MSYPEAALDLLQAPGTAILSTKTPSGAIQSTAIWYLFEDGDLKIFKTAGGEPDSIPVSGGFAEVGDKGLVVLAESAGA